MFIAALFTIAKIWKQYSLLPKHEWIKKMCRIYTTEYYSAIKENEILPFATTWMELDGITLSEITRRKTNPVCFTYIWNLKNKTNEQI